VRSTSPLSYVGDFRALGYRFRLRSNLADAATVLGRLFHAFACDDREDPESIYDILQIAPDAPDGYDMELVLDGSSVNRSGSPGNMLDWIVSDVTAAAMRSPVDAALVHASSATRRGSAVVMPAPPEHGKTTTIAGLVRAGWDFLTDETAVISFEDGLVHPFPRPLMISPASMAVLPGLKGRLPEAYETFRHFDYHVAPDDLRPGCLSGPAPARFVVFPSYGDGSPTQLTPIPRAEALTELLKSCFNLPRVSGRGVEALAGVVRGAACYRLSIGAIEPAVRVIQGLVEGDGAEAAAL
jgi:hypothetical protein